MISAQSNLTMIGLNTPTPQVFWKGQKVDGITKITSENKEGVARVTLTFKQDPLLAEMQDAGIIIKREV